MLPRNSYGEKPLSPDKGKEGGSCNRRACQAPHSAFCYNRVMDAWYCRECANAINHGCTIVNIPDNYNTLFKEARKKYLGLTDAEADEFFD